MTTFSSRLFALCFATAALAATQVACSAAPVEEDVEATEGALASFVCDRAEISKNVPNAGYGQVTKVRAAGHDGFDRFVMEFDASSVVPNYHVARQRGATFFYDGSGLPVTVPGQAGLNIIAHSASGYDFETGAPSYTGPNRFSPPGAKLMTEGVSTGDFEGVVAWGVGLKRAACYRVFELANPPRLVVDVQNNGPTPVDPPEPPGTEFQCGGEPIGRTRSDAFGQLVDVRSAGHPDYDRFVMEFSRDTAVPNFEVTYQATTTFSDSAKGVETTVPGAASLKVVLQGASSWDFEAGHATYTGPQTITPAGGEVLLKAKEFDNFEGQIGWVLGLAENFSCYRAFKLADPPRLVVDVMR